MPLFVPTLRERQEDILPLSRLFLARNNRKYDLERVLTPEMQQGLLNYPWPGNIRELRNVIERYAISGRMDLAPPEMTAVSGNCGKEDKQDETVPLHQACANFERDYICRTLKACGGSVSRAAQRLGIHRTLLYKKIKKLGVETVHSQSAESGEETGETDSKISSNML